MGMSSVVLALVTQLSLTAPAADSADLVLRINLPERRLEVVEDGMVIRSYAASIGSRRYQTPTGSFGIQRIEWNPWWVPPESDWAVGKKRTPPGPNNPMGRVKMQFDDLLYIHGTSNEKDLGEPTSHGCIRLSNADALELARLLAERAGVLPENVDELEARTSRTRSVALTAPIPLRIQYRLVEEADGALLAHEDVYKRGLMPGEKALMEMLEAGQAEAADDAEAYDDGGAAVPPPPPPGPGVGSEAPMAPLLHK